MMRIAFYLPEFADGGVERMALTQARTLLELGYAVDFVTYNIGSGFLGQIPPGTRLIDLGVRRTLASLPGLSRYLRDQTPDAIISAHYFANIVAVLARMLARTTHVPLILTERTALKTLMRYEPGHISRKHILAMRLTYGQASHIVANSQGTARELSELLKCPLGKIKVIYNPAFDPAITVRGEEPVDCAWLTAGAAPVLVAAGRLVYPKDFATLLRAFRIVRDRRDCKLIILGKGPERERLETLCRELQLEADVLLAGFTANPYKFIRRAAAFVLSSRYEGLGNVLIEAQALGVPVVATDCSSGPAEVLLDGEAGMLVPVSNPQALAQGVLRLLDDQHLAAQYVRAGYQHLERFSPTRCVEQYLELIHARAYA